MLHALFSFKGRLNRAPYWGYSLLMMAILGIPLIAYIVTVSIQLANAGTLTESELQAAVNSKLLLPLIVVMAATLWPSLALMVKRLHDHGKSGMLAVPLMVPGLAYNLSSITSPDSSLTLGLAIVTLLIGIFSFVYLGCMRGTVGPNQYGNDPLDRVGTVPTGMQPA